MVYFQVTAQGAVFKVYVQPRASRNEISGCRQDALKIRLNAPPVDGEANKACLKFLAGKLGIPRSALEIISGATCRTKKIRVHIPGEDGRQQAADRIRRQIETLARQKKDAKKTPGKKGS